MRALAILLFTVVFGCLTLSVYCRHQLPGPPVMERNPDSHTNTTVVASTLDEIKLKISFCEVKTFCDHSPCYCCPDPNRCYNTMEECRAKCFVCNPRCSLQNTSVHG
ncbi:unnamed protein product [Urochloa decumbens]|uniref:Uncharacterized protein n=1 Tax=Urochloa decumbens TaxID=240449 RepID=A0ABC9HHE0_9POAL